MHGYIVREHGGADALRWEELPDPTPGPGEVGIAVRACGINHLDIWVRKGTPGHPFPLPLIPGSDVAGEVFAVGPGVRGVSVGDAVAIAPGVSCGFCRLCLSGRDHHCRGYGILGEHRHGGYAEKIVMPRVNVTPKPPNLSFVETAAFGVAFLTAWHMLVERAALQPGETVLVQAAGSGVGSAAIQIARMWSARVIATASTDDKCEAARALGAHEVINSRTGDVAKTVKALTGGQGADVVFEHVGPDTWQQSCRALSWQGRLVTCGATTGPQVQLNLQHLFFKSQTILGSTMGSKGDFARVLEHAAAGRLRPVVDRKMPLRDAPAAHTLLEERQIFGKIVLVCGDAPVA